MGIVAIEGMQFYAHHGYYKEEQVLGGKFTVDIYIHSDLSVAAAFDELKHTVNYERVFQITKQEMEIHSKLLENVCSRILDKVKVEFPFIQSIRVKVTKEQPPIKGSVSKVFVELQG